MPGPQPAPAIPSSGTAFTNPYPWDCLVTVRGGTVTAIEVDGITIGGLTTGMVTVPQGKAIKLTYAVAPSWDWLGLMGPGDTPNIKAPS